MSDSIDGVYKGRAIAESVKWGASPNDNDQCSLDLVIPRLEMVGTTILTFTERSAQWSFDRLRAAGWDGTLLPDGFPDLRMIGKQDCFVRVQYETYEGKGQLRFEIHTGKIEIEEFRPEQRKAVGDRLKALAAKHAPKNSQAPRT